MYSFFGVNCAIAAEWGLGDHDELTDANDNFQ